MTQSTDQPTTSKQGCRECGEMVFHNKITCPLVSGRDKSLYRAVPVLDSERSAGDENPREAEESNFNPDRLITEPRTLGEVYEKERVGAIVTECCGMAIGPDCRFCPKCG